MSWKMSPQKVIILLFAACAFALAQNESIVKVDPEPIKPTSPSPPNSTTSTTPTTTTTKLTTTTTTKKPTTTTSKSTTTTPTTTTSKPTPTTKPTPTPKPTPAPPVPDPVINTFSGNYTGTNRTCLMMKVALQLEILVKGSNSTKINIPVKNDTSSNGNCTSSDKGSESLTLTWENNSITFDFVKLNTSKYEIASVQAVILSPGANTTTTYVHKKSEFATFLSNSYKCARVQTLNITKDMNSTEADAFLHISHLQYEAFMNSTELHFDSAWDCDGANTPDVVPIVVGCVLAVLVVLVLVAYLFGRRRCQARGYLSM